MDEELQGLRGRVTSGYLRVEGDAPLGATDTEVTLEGPVPATVEEMDPKVVPFGALYQVDLKVHMGKDKRWGREENRNVRRTLQSRQPEVLVEDVWKAMVEILTMTDDNFILGLLLNLINKFPDEIRQRIVAGIVNGIGMKILPEEGRLAVGFGQLFATLALNQEGEKRTASGIILPGGVNS